MNHFKTFLLMLVLTAIFILVGSAIGGVRAFDHNLHESIPGMTVTALLAVAGIGVAAGGKGSGVFGVTPFSDIGMTRRRFVALRADHLTDRIVHLGGIAVMVVRGTMAVLALNIGQYGQIGIPGDQSVPVPGSKWGGRESPAIIAHDIVKTVVIGQTVGVVANSVAADTTA